MKHSASTFSIPYPTERISQDALRPRPDDLPGAPRRRPSDDRQLAPVARPIAGRGEPRNRASELVGRQVPRRNRPAARRRAGVRPGRGSAARAGQRRRPRGAADRPRLLLEDGHAERRLEAAAARLQRIDADHLGQHDLPEHGNGREHRRARAVGDRPHEPDRSVEATDRGREPHGAQAEHVVAVAAHRRPHGVGDDGRRRAQGVRLRRQGAVVAQHPGRLRQVRAELGLRLVAAAARRRALRAGAARHEDGRPVLRDEDRRGRQARRSGASSG